MFRTKVRILAILRHLKWPKWPPNGHFGHSGQSEVSENGPNGFPMPKNLGIDTKIKSLACSEPKLQIWPFYLILVAQKCQKMPKTAYHSSIHDLWTPAGKPVVLTTRSRRRLTRRGVRHTWTRSLNTCLLYTSPSPRD